MLNNWLNIHDFEKLGEKIRQGKWRQILTKLFTHSRNRAHEAWKHVQNAPINAWDIPAIRKRWDALVSGNADVDHVDYISRKYLKGCSTLTALSPGCGTGTNELRWVKTGCFARIDAFDFSAQRIAIAQENARQKNCSAIVHFQVSDMKDFIRNEQYDLILLEGALHHFYPMRNALTNIKKLLKPGGLIIVMDFVGPSRFQWTARQIECANASLALIPEPYRRKWQSRTLKKHVCPPSRLSMILSDPSEAAQSSLILPLCREMFIPIEEIKIGGTLINLVFFEIAHHYLHPDETAGKILQTCFDVEDMLMQSGDISSDYVLAIFQKKTQIQI